MSIAARGGHKDVKTFALTLQNLFVSRRGLHFQFSGDEATRLALEGYLSLFSQSELFHCQVDDSGTWTIDGYGFELISPFFKNCAELRSRAIRAYVRTRDVQPQLVVDDEVFLIPEPEPATALEPEIAEEPIQEDFTPQEAFSYIKIPVTRDAATIRSAYRKASLLHHPDLGHTKREWQTFQAAYNWCLAFAARRVR